MPDRFEAHYVKGTGMGIDIYSTGKDVICSGCGKKFAKDSDFRRHWRVPIPCQIHNCPKTFRDDKLRPYLNHHASEHCNDEQDEHQLQSYFREKGKDLRHSFVPNLCVNKLGFPPESNSPYFGNMPSAVTVSSTEPWNDVLGYATADADVHTLISTLSAPETSIGSSPLTPATTGLFNAPDFLPSGPQLTRVGTGFDCGRENLQAMRADSPRSYRREQRHHSQYLQRLLTGNRIDEESLEGKIKVTEEELDKFVLTEEIEFQAPSGHEFMWDHFILDPSFDGQNEAQKIKNQEGQ